MVWPTTMIVIPLAGEPAGAGCFWILGVGAGAGADREKTRSRSRSKKYQEPEPQKIYRLLEDKKHKDIVHLLLLFR